MKPKMIIWVFVLVLLSANVLSLGLSPVKSAVDFQPDLSKEFTLTILNNEEKDFDVVITVEGDLKEYITLSQKERNEEIARHQLQKVL